MSATNDALLPDAHLSSERYLLDACVVTPLSSAGVVSAAELTTFLFDELESSEFFTTFDMRGDRGRSVDWI